MTRSIREETPDFPHEFTVQYRKDIWTGAGPTRRNHATYGHCMHCGKPYLSPHDFYTECRKRKEKQNNI